MILGASIFGIKLYAICILIGIILAYIQGQREGKRLGLDKNFIFYGLIIIVPLSIIGARIWYVLFNLDDFDSFAEVCGFQDGSFVGLSGLAIQGGVMVAIISIIVYSRVQKVSLYKVLDIVAPGFLIGQICGRFGNFFNQELYGPIVGNESLFLYFFPSWLTDNMYISGYYRQPAFFYEAFFNFLGLMFIFFIRRRAKWLKSGDLIGIYLCWYGPVRIFTESLRLHGSSSDPLMWNGIPVSILMSVVFIIVGATYLILKRCVKKMDSVHYLDIINDVADKKVDTVIFDLDGTLLDTKSLIDHTFIYTFQHFFPQHELSDEELSSFFGPTLYDSFSKYTKDDKKINKMIDYYRAYNKEHHDEFVKPFEGAREVLATISKKGYKVAVVSSKTKEMVEYGLARFSMLKYVDFIIGEGEIIPKPNPEGILVAMNNFKYSRNAVYVGDNPSDILAAKNADKYYKNKKIDKTMKSCAVMYSPKFSEMEKLNPDYYVGKLINVFDFLNI